VIDQELQAVLQSAGPEELVPVIVILSDKVDITKFKSKEKKIRRSKIIKALKARHQQRLADSSLKDFLASLKGTQLREARVRPLWIINGVAIKLRPHEIQMTEKKGGVDVIRLDGTIQVPQVEAGFSAMPEWNLHAIRAHDLWSLGYTGQGVVVASMDTGVDGNHPDLAGRWRGGTNSWFDANDPEFDPRLDNHPYDPNGHGTAVMGLVVGGDEGGSTIGVAPGAQWIAVKIFNSAGVASESDIHAGFQWLLDPDGDPDSDDAPDIVTNSWGFDRNPDRCVEEVRGISFRADVQILKQAGMALVFSAGNRGPSPYTSVSPANYPESFSVGAVDENSAVSDFSSRGPSACDGAVFPHVVAPGERAAFPFGIRVADLALGQPDPYTYCTGTSFAAPHASGAMALLLSAFPTLSPEQLEASLKAGAQDLGPSGPDNEYGYGLIDVLEAYLRLVDDVLITRAAYNDGRGQLLVEATSSSQPDVTLAAEGYGDLLWDSARKLYRRVFGNVAVKPVGVTVKSSGGGSAIHIFPAPETVSIARVLYSDTRSQLLVEATCSSQPDAALNAQRYGSLPWDSGRNLYRRVFTNVTIKPADVTVISSGGGSATKRLP
jgi:bacillopeptidase F